MSNAQVDQQPLLTVLMLTYNHMEFLPTALDSILSQKTKFTFHVHIFDDASSDGTPDIIKAYAEKYPDKVRPFLATKNIGAIRNFQKSLQSSKSRYSALCEGDDYWLGADKLQTQVDLLEREQQLAGCFHNVFVKTENEDSEMFPWRTYDRSVYTINDTIAIRSPFHTCSFVYRTELLDIPDWFHEIVSGDMTVFTLIASKGDIGRVEGNMGVYRKHEQGITSGELLVNYHTHRTRLWKNFRSYLNTSHTFAVDEVLKHHTEELEKLAQQHKSASSSGRLLGVIRKIKERIMG